MIIAVSIMRWKTSCQGVLVRRALHFGFSEKVGISHLSILGMEQKFQIKWTTLRYTSGSQP